MMYLISSLGFIIASQAAAAAICEEDPPKSKACPVVWSDLYGRDARPPMKSTEAS